MNRLRSLLTVCVMVAGVAPALALSPEARGTAMGGTLSPFASGAEGLWWNDGALGKPLLLSAVLGGGLEGGNNALTLSQIMGVVQQTQSGKDDAVKAIRTEGKWDARIEGVGVGGVTIWGIGVGVFPHVLLSAKDVSPDAAEYALEGTIPYVAVRTYVIKGEYTRAAYNEAVIGYAHDLPTFIPGISLSAGAGLKYFMGTDYDFVKTDQSFTTGPAIPSSNSEHTNASKGTGMGFDLGVQGSIMSVVKAGISVRNLGAKITWKGASRQTGYFDSSNLTFVSTTSTKDVAETLPTTILIGAGGSIPVVGTSAGVSLESDTTNKENKLHLGLEQSFAGVFALRAGYLTGAGPAPAQVTFGLGLGAIVAHLDVGAGLALNGKGGSAAISANVNI